MLHITKLTTECDLFKTCCPSFLFRTMLAIIRPESFIEHHLTKLVPNDSNGRINSF